MRIAHFFLLLLCPLLGFSQSEYPPETLQKFTNLYLSAKSISPSQDTEIQILFKEHNISPERYRAIFRQSLIEGMPELTPNEVAFIEAVKRKGVELDKKKELALQELCARNDFDFTTYLAIQKKYKTDLKFERSLQPYFNNSLKQK